MSNVANCPYCHEPIKPGVTVIRCPVCGMGHHKECWHSNNRHCAVFGCAGRGEGVVLGATATTVAPSIANKTTAGSKQPVMKTAPIRAIKEGLGGDMIECPHCGGTTVCNLWGDGSCIYCLGHNNAANKGDLVICQTCEGEGEIELPYDYKICRHCGGTGHCQHKTGKYASCVTCRNATKASYRNSHLIDGTPEEPIRCSVCDGTGYREI